MNKKLNEKIRMRDMAHDVEAIRNTFYSTKGRNAVKQLKKNGFEAYYTDNRQDAAKLLISLIPDQSLIGVGDSHTVFALDVDDALEEKGCTLVFNKEALNLHRYNSTEEKGYIKAPTREEARAQLADFLTSNVFLLGANAITMKGEIVNMDGVGNRIAGSLYGADRIIVVAGINKLVPDENAAKERIHFTAAPMNKIKYGDECACVKTGICHDCSGPERICNIMTILHRKPFDSDFHVIIIGEELGF